MSASEEDSNQLVYNSFKHFLQTYTSGGAVKSANTTGANVSTASLSVTDNPLETVVLRNRQSTDSCLFSDHTISPNDVEPEVFDWIFYHLDYKKCPYPLAFALASIVARKLGLAEKTRESQDCVDYSKPALSSNELYSQSLEYLTEYINSWKDNPELAVEIAKEYSQQTFISSICAIKNSRRKMEDRHVILHDLNKALNLKVSKQYNYYAIFDGHAGVDAASYLSAHLHYTLVTTQAFLDGDIVGAFKEAFSKVDLHYLERSARESRKSGSTALCALLENKTKLYLAWLGDSQAVLVKNGQPIDVMIPHKPELEEERKRIEELGGFVAFVDTWRVNGTLAVSRAIGDPEHKPYISSEPDVVTLDVGSDTDFLILACDGLWDNVTTDEATSLVFEYICQHQDLNTQQIAEGVSAHLSKVAKDDGSSDNITTIVIFFKDIEDLRATPFKPLTPREKSNGLNGSHFQYTDSMFEQMLKNGNNPFDMSSCGPLSWSSGSSMDEMNKAKINFSVDDSIDVNEMNSANEMFKEDSNNPFNVSNNMDLNANPNKMDNNLLDTIDNNSESFTGGQTNSFIVNETQDSQTTENSNRSEQQSESQINISKLSDISSSFVTQAEVHSEQAFASTPIKTSEPFNYNSMSGDEQSLDNNMSSIIFNNQTSDPIVNEASNEEPKNITRESFETANSELDMSYSFDKSGYTTAYEQELEQQLNDSREETPIQTPVKEMTEQMATDVVDDANNQDINDMSSGAESVDSYVYEKINSDMSEITKRVENDYYSQQNDLSLRFESELHIGSDDQKVDVLKGEDLMADINTAIDNSNADMIREALLSEHMTAEEAEEVAQQLTGHEETNESSLPSDIDLVGQPKHELFDNEFQTDFYSQQTPESIDIEESKNIEKNVDLVTDINTHDEDSHMFDSVPHSMTLPQVQPLVPQELNDVSVEEQAFNTESNECYERSKDSEQTISVDNDLMTDMQAIESDIHLNDEVLLSKQVINDEFEVNQQFQQSFDEQNINQYLEPEVIITETPLEVNANPFEFSGESNDVFSSHNIMAAEVEAHNESDISLRPESEQLIDSEVLAPDMTYEQQYTSQEVPLIPEQKSLAFESDMDFEDHLQDMTQPEVATFEAMPETNLMVSELNTSLVEESPELLITQQIEESLESMIIIPEPNESIPETTLNSDAIVLNEEQNEAILGREEPIESTIVNIAPEEKSIETQLPLDPVVPEVKTVIKPKEVVSATTKVLKTAAKPLASKLTTTAKTATTKTLTKSDPKTTKPAATSASLSKAPAKTTTTSRPAATKISAVSAAKSTLPLKSAVDKKPSPVASVRPKTTTTATARPSAALASAPKTTTASKPPSRSLTTASRPTSTVAARTATTTSKVTTTSKAPESKPITKAVPTRAPVAPRATSATSASARTTTASAATRTSTTALRTTPTARTNGTTAATTTKPSPTKAPIKSTTTLKTTTASRSTTATSAKPPVNGVKVSPTRAPVATKTATTTSRPIATRTPPTKPLTSLSSKTIADKKPKSTAPLKESKPGVKPIGVKGENKSSPVPKTNGVSAAPTSPTPAAPIVTMTTSVSMKNNNRLKVENSLQQELEDAALLSQLTPDSEDNYTNVNTIDRSLISNNESLILDSNPDVNGN